MHHGHYVWFDGKRCYQHIRNDGNRCHSNVALGTMCTLTAPLCAPNDPRVACTNPGGVAKCLSHVQDAKW